MLERPSCGSAQTLGTVSCAMVPAAAPLRPHLERVACSKDETGSSTQRDAEDLNLLQHVLGMAVSSEEL